MAMLYAKCPATRDLIETGIRTDDDSLMIIAHAKVTVWCQMCGQQHITRVQELYCSAEEPAAA